MCWLSCPSARPKVRVARRFRRLLCNRVPPGPSLVLTADQLANYNVGDIVAVDSDYTGTIGYVGAGAPAAYLSSPLNPSTQSDFIRRVTFNVSRVSSKTSTSLLLAQPLIGVPSSRYGRAKSRGVR